MVHTIITKGTYEILKEFKISKDYLVSEYDLLKFLEIMNDKEVLDLLGLIDRTRLTIVIENGIEKYLKEI